jgi:pyridoxine 5-phosphate synthase
MPHLAVNVDHVATLRQARLAAEPDPVLAASLAELSGAAAIIVHLREDRRHIQDRDVDLLRRTVKTRLHLEMAATAEMQGIALRVHPDLVCLVPEKRRELTTEGGLDVAERESMLAAFVAPLAKAGIETSLFIDPDPAQVEAAAKTGAGYVELHTGTYAEAKSPGARRAEFERLLDGLDRARRLGLKVNMGHGLDYQNILAFSGVSGVNEYSIGHAIMARAVITGLPEAVSRMANIVSGFVS